MSIEWINKATCGEREGEGVGRQRDREVFSKHLSQRPASFEGDPCLQARLMLFFVHFLLRLDICMYMIPYM